MAEQSRSLIQKAR